jgi:hypothetical protein
VSDEQSEFVMRYSGGAPPGPKGDKGEQGALPARARRSLLARDIVIICLLLLNFLFTAHYVNSQQSAAQRAGAKVIAKVCAGFARLAAEKPPAGNPATNPSRAFDQGQHATLVGIGADLCR